jgi:hypothetical protein
LKRRNQCGVVLIDVVDAKEAQQETVGEPADTIENISGAGRRNEAEGKGQDEGVADESGQKGS